GGAIDEAVGSGRGRAGVIAVGIDGEAGDLLGSLMQGDGAAGLRRSGGIGDFAVNFSGWLPRGGRGSLGKRGHHGQSQQSNPERNRAFHLLLLGSFGERKARVLDRKVSVYV